MAKTSSQRAGGGPTRAPVPGATATVHQYRDALRDAIELPITTRGVLYVLAQWMNVDGTNAYPSLKRLAASCQLRQRAVAGHLARAVDAGYLVQTSGGHKGRTAVYRAAIPLYRWDATSQRIVQPDLVAEPPRSLHVCVGCDRAGCTGKHQSLHEDAGFEGQSLQKSAAKPARVCSPTSTTTSVLLLPRTSTHSDAGASPPTRSVGADFTANDEADDLASSEAGVEPQTLTRPDEGDQQDPGDAAVNTQGSARDDLGSGEAQRERELYYKTAGWPKTERLWDYIDGQVGGLEADRVDEESLMLAMLERGEHPNKIVNRINKIRAGVPG